MANYLKERFFITATSGLEDPVLTENSDRRFQIVTCDGPQAPLSEPVGLYEIVDEFLLPQEPVLQLDPSFKFCSQEFRDELNEWLLKRFGTIPVAYSFEDKLLISSAMEARLMAMDLEISREIYGI